MLVLNTQLSGDGHDLRDILSRSGNLRAHLLDRVGQAVIFLFGGIHSLSNVGKGVFIIDGCLNGGGAQCRDGSRDVGREGFSGLGHGFGDRLTFLGDSSQGFACLCPCGLHPVQLFCQPADFRFRVLHSGFGVVQVGGGLADSVRAVLHGFLQSLDLTLQLGDLGGGIRIFFLVPLQILLGGNGGGVRFAQGITVILISDGCCFHLEAQVFLPGLCLLQPLGVVLMPVVVFLQLIVRCHQSPTVLFHGPLLLGKLLSQHGQLGFRACDGLFVVLYTSPGQTEGGLGFLDLRVDGAHITREIAGVQRQRDHQFAQGFSHKSSPLFDCRRFRDNGRILVRSFGSTIVICGRLD